MSQLTKSFTWIRGDRRTSTNGAQRRRWTILAVLAGACCVHTVQSASAATVHVRNSSRMPITVRVAEQTRNLTESKDGVELDHEIAAQMKVSQSGSIGIPDTLDLSSATTVEGAGSEKNYSNVQRERKYNWSEFIKPGHLVIAPKKTGRFTINTRNLYYLSVSNSRGIVCVNIPKSVKDDLIIMVTDSGLVDAHDRVIEIGDQIELKCVKTKRWLGVEANDYATLSSAPGKYKLTQGFRLGGTFPNFRLTEINKGNAVTTDSVVYLKHGGQYLYNSAEGWARFDKETDGDNSQWSLLKVRTNETEPDDKIRSGDVVLIQNINNKDEYIGDRGDDEAEVEDKDDFKGPTYFQWVVEFIAAK